MVRRGKAIAIATVTFGLAVLVGAGIAAKDRIAEEWWIYKLRTGSQDQKQAAAAALADMASVRAVPVIAGLLQSHRDGARGDLCRLLKRIVMYRETYREIHLEETAKRLANLLRDTDAEVIETVLLALGRIGFHGTETIALPIVMNYARHGDWGIRYTALVILGAVETQVAATVSCLQGIADSVEENPIARYLARRSLRRLGGETCQPGPTAREGTPP